MHDPSSRRSRATRRGLQCGAALLAALAGLVRCASAAETAAKTDDAELRQRITAALERGLPLVEKAAARYPEHRKCFSCHHQTLPMLAIVSARHAGMTVDTALLEAQAE